MRINLDLELLRTLVAFADTGSFKRAAQLVYRSQPAVSMQMRRLEDLLGHALFTKQGRGVTFTEKGLQLVAQARQIVIAHDRLVDQMHGAKVEGRVRLGIPDDYAVVILPAVLRRLNARFPGVNVDIVANTSPVLVQMLAAGDLDLAILAAANPEPEDLVLRREPIAWVTSSEHDTHLRRPLPLALFADESPIYRATIAALTGRSDAEALDFQIVLRSKSASVLVAAAMGGFAVATMARCVVPVGLTILSERDGVPDAGHIHVVMRATQDSQSLATSRLTGDILDSFRGDPVAFEPPALLLGQGPDAAE
ncbi:LysR substrate-binding domain-containing protein [Sphingomonas sp. HITSZ_GF]|uniref:LysR substrate-binding domain-containing protein n=1 Tax=Sphingomonas sp. HITSZ_GF TaxID=3037247 RepID=UPI00240E5F3B|nr:LysR substrate-binding domain-containing protein [Sphingomonas sp. HITSZ_GF]MDG2535886.1 LysR substrate-binding domain-containing protein [Sphingomonas sp. HITSZ_GF]